MRLNWRGDKLKAKMRRCAQQAVNITMTEAVLHAKRNHPWTNRTGTLEGAISITQPAMPEGSAVVGRWGVRGVKYAIYLELKDAWRYLRPAADKTYPNLARRLKECWNHGV